MRKWKFWPLTTHDWPGVLYVGSGECTNCKREMGNGWEMMDDVWLLMTGGYACLRTFGARCEVPM